MKRIVFGVYEFVMRGLGKAASWIESRPCAIGLHPWGRVKPIEGGYYYQECERCFAKRHL